MHLQYVITGEEFTRYKKTKKNTRVINPTNKEESCVSKCPIKRIDPTVRLTRINRTIAEIPRGLTAKSVERPSQDVTDCTDIINNTSHGMFYMDSFGIMNYVAPRYGPTGVARQAIDKSPGILIRRTIPIRKYLRGDTFTLNVEMEILRDNATGAMSRALRDLERDHYSPARGRMDHISFEYFVPLEDKPFDEAISIKGTGYMFQSEFSAYAFPKDNPDMRGVSQYEYSEREIEENISQCEVHTQLRFLSRTRNDVRWLFVNGSLEPLYAIHCMESEPGVKVLIKNGEPNLYGAKNARQRDLVRFIPYEDLTAENGFYLSEHDSNSPAIALRNELGAKRREISDLTATRKELEAEIKKLKGDFKLKEEEGKRAIEQLTDNTTIQRSKEINEYTLRITNLTNDIVKLEQELNACQIELKSLNTIKVDYENLRIRISKADVENAANLAKLEEAHRNKIDSLHNQTERMRREIMEQARQDTEERIRTRSEYLEKELDSSVRNTKRLEDLNKDQKVEIDRYHRRVEELQNDIRRLQDNEHKRRQMEAQAQGDNPGGIFGLGARVLLQICTHFKL